MNNPLREDRSHRHVAGKVSGYGMNRCRVTCAVEGCGIAVDSDTFREQELRYEGADEALAVLGLTRAHPFTPQPGGISSMVSIAQDLRRRKQTIITYLMSKAQSGTDWHAVQDAASDIRELDAQLELLDRYPELLRDVDPAP